ncbi:MAG: aminoacetone oxidase family FAD-binding enzyme [Prevotella sp.]|nr:aminoacetone oxidase family FAD-binding enzyme [Prevotella sp.]
MRTAIVGGGAAGFFLALNLKELVPEMEVVIFERAQHVLKKVEVSGGGRCNCTNTFADVKDLSAVYPRGHRLMKRLMKGFSHHDAYRWFESRGVRLTVQSDQCVFPASQDAHTIINCFLAEARRQGIVITTGSAIDNPAALLSDYDFVAVTTGGQPRADGLAWAERLGIETVQPVPSLFTLCIDDPQIHALMGTVADEAAVFLTGTKLRASGPLLLTHWGMSGPAVLKLSSYGARWLAEQHYRGTLGVNWTAQSEADIQQLLADMTAAHPQRQLTTTRLPGIANRLWDYLATKSLGQRAAASWGSLNRKELNRLVNILTNDQYQVTGRSPFRDEFVTCGGIALSAVNAVTLESRAVGRLYFAGEVLDIDGITGGFNFQAAWTTAYTVASAIKKRTE